MSFQVLGLDDRILKAIRDAGYTEPTPIQSAAVPQIIAGHDVIGIAQTGTGKTAAFTLPVLTKLCAKAPDASRRRTRVLIVAPTRELVVQIEENVCAYAKHLPALRIAKVFGGVGERPQMDALRAGADIVIATPGRLLDLMGRGCADFSALEVLILDEADRMLDMGFVPDIRRIVKALPKQRQTLLFSATLSNEIEGLTREFLHTPKKVEIGRRSNPAETVTQMIYEVRKEDKVSLLAHLLRDSSMDMVLVFTRTKHGADKVAKRLARDGVTSAALHANRSQNQRLKALADFKSGKVRVLVATDIASRGIDVDGISHVVNFDFPPHVEDYVHRIGRTGRANAVGDAISFVSRDDYGALRSLEKFIGRGIVRKSADGFVPDPAGPDDERPVRPQQRQQRGQGQQTSGGQQQRGQGSRGGQSQRPTNRSAGPPPRPQQSASSVTPARPQEEEPQGWRRPTQGRRQRRR